MITWEKPKLPSLLEYGENSKYHYYNKRKAQTKLTQGKLKLQPQLEHRENSKLTCP